jgi:hypothetical protein
VSGQAEYRCGVCGAAHDVDHVYDEGGGSVICHECYAARAAALAASTAAAAAGQPVAYAEGDEGTDSAGPPMVRPVRKPSPNRGLWVILGGVVGVAAAVAIAVIAMRPAAPADPTAQAGSGGAATSSAATGQETNVQRVNRLWRAARDRTRQRDNSGAAALYAEMFQAIEADPAISGNRSLMADLTPARREWQLANDAAGLPPLSDGQTGRVPAAAAAPPIASGVAAGTDPETPNAGARAAGAAVVKGVPKQQQAGAQGGETRAGAAAADARDAADAPAGEEPPKTELAEKTEKGSGEEAAGRQTRKGRAAAPREPAAAAAAAESQVTAMLDDAERLEARGDKAAALARYTEAFRAVGDRSQVRDPALRKRLAKALTARAELIGQLRGGEGMREMTLEALMNAGAQALESGKWQAALDSLADAKQVVEERTKLPAERNADPHYIPALHGMAVAYLKLKKNPKAGELFDDKAPLGRASLNAPDRALVWNRAVIDMIQKYKIMRAVKGLREHFDRDPDNNPEEMINLFGTALSTAYRQFEDDEKKPPSLLVDAIKVYERLERQLESGRPGQRRWGVRWISEGEFNQKMDETRRLEGEIQQLVNNALPNAKRRLAEEERGRPVRVRGSRRVRYVVDQGEVNAARAHLKQVRADIKTARGKIPQRDWLATYDPVVPEIGVPTALASAAAAEPARGLPGRTGAANGGSGGGPVRPPPPGPGPEPGPAVPPPEPAVADATPPGVARPEPVVPARRRVQRYAAAFPVDGTRLITASAPLGEADTVFIEDSQGGAMRARVIAKNDQLALLEVDAESVNGGMPFLNLSTGFGGGAVRCAGLPTPTLFGPAVEVIEGRAGRPPEGGAGWNVSLPRHPRLAGAPLLDAADQTVVGVVVGARDDPSAQLPAVSVALIRAFLAESNALPAAPCANPDPTAVYQVTIEE